MDFIVSCARDISEFGGDVDHLRSGSFLTLLLFSLVGGNYDALLTSVVREVWITLSLDTFVQGFSGHVLDFKGTVLLLDNLLKQVHQPGLTM